MYKINKNIAIKQKFTKFLYLETIIWLLVSVIVLSITSLFLKNLLIKLFYVFVGMIFTFLLLLPSPNNPDKTIITSIIFFKKRYKKTVVILNLVPNRMGENDYQKEKPLLPEV